MLFTLEALNAAKGDSLIVHYGDAKKPNLIVIDGGPDGVYANALKPRLEQILKKFKKSADDPLPIEMVMVSHIDDDHINGILDWFGDVKKTTANSGCPFTFDTLWFNSFDDVAGNAASEIVSRVASLPTAQFPGDRKSAEHTQAIIASVAQGKKLRDLAAQLAIAPNHGFAGLVMAKAAGKTVVRQPGGLQLTILAPNKQRLEDLNKEWEKTIKPKKDAALTAAFVDKSVANLSSIVVLAELTSKGKTRSMLLTGDARGDDLMIALQDAKLLKKDKLKVDVFKLPHHGSNRNSAVELFEMIVAGHYVISADGEHENPDTDVFEWIAKARGGDAYTIHITNEKLRDKKKNIEAAVKKVLQATEKDAPNRKIVFREDSKLSIRVDLFDPLPY